MSVLAQIGIATFVVVYFLFTFITLSSNNNRTHNEEPIDKREASKNSAVIALVLTVFWVSIFFLFGVR